MIIHCGQIGLDQFFAGVGVTPTAEDLAALTPHYNGTDLPLGPSEFTIFDREHFPDEGQVTLDLIPVGAVTYREQFIIVVNTPGVTPVVTMREILWREPGITSGKVSLCVKRAGRPILTTTPSSAHEAGARALLEHGTEPHLGVRVAKGGWEAAGYQIKAEFMEYAEVVLKAAKAWEESNG